MSYEIPIEDDVGIVVARVVWDGELYQGEARVATITGHERQAQQIASMILNRADLKSLRLRSEGEQFTVRGWQGYEGVVGALRIMLPSLGFKIGHLGGNIPALGRVRREEIKKNTSEGGIE